MTSEEFMDSMNQKVAFNIKSGVEITHVEPGKISGRMKERADNGNHLGDIAAGAIFTLGELMPAALVIRELDDNTLFLVVKRIEIDFINVGRGVLTATSELDDKTSAEIEAFRSRAKKKIEITLPVTVRDPAEKVVAKLMGTYYIRAMSAGLKRKMA